MVVGTAPFLRKASYPAPVAVVATVPRLADGRGSTEPGASPFGHGGSSAPGAERSWPAGSADRSGNARHRGPEARSRRERVREREEEGGCCDDLESEMEVLLSDCVSVLCDVMGREVDCSYVAMHVVE